MAVMARLWLARWFERALLDTLPTLPIIYKDGGLSLYLICIKLPNDSFISFSVSFLASNTFPGLAFHWNFCSQRLFVPIHSTTRLSSLTARLPNNLLTVYRNLIKDLSVSLWVLNGISWSSVIQSYTMFNSVSWVNLKQINPLVKYPDGWIGDVSLLYHHDI